MGWREPEDLKREEEERRDYGIQRLKCVPMSMSGIDWILSGELMLRFQDWFLFLFFLEK